MSPVKVDSNVATGHMHSEKAQSGLHLPRASSSSQEENGDSPVLFQTKKK